MASPWRPIRVWSPLLVLGFLVALIAFALQFSWRRHLPPRLWTVEDLALYNGTDERLPILLGILGSVFDVTKGKTHYGPGGGYHHFAGRDASRAFVSGNFTVLQLIGSCMAETILAPSGEEHCQHLFLTQMPPFNHCEDLKWTRTP